MAVIRILAAILLLSPLGVLFIGFLLSVGHKSKNEKRILNKNLQEYHSRIFPLCVCLF